MVVPDTAKEMFKNFDIRDVSITEISVIEFLGSDKYDVINPGAWDRFNMAITLMDEMLNPKVFCYDPEYPNGSTSVKIAACIISMLITERKNKIYITSCSPFSSYKASYTIVACVDSIEELHKKLEGVESVIRVNEVNER